VRQLAALVRSASASRIKDVISGRREEDVRRALLATRRVRPDDVMSYFTASLGPEVLEERVGPAASGTTPRRSVEDPYASQ
jgi:hypothetical protein